MFIPSLSRIKYLTKGKNEGPIGIIGNMLDFTPSPNSSGVFRESSQKLQLPLYESVKIDTVTPPVSPWVSGITLSRQIN